MTRYRPGSQTRVLMEEKRELAEKLLGKGLSVAQVAEQLRCSRPFVRRVRQKVERQAVEA